MDNGSVCGEGAQISQNMNKLDGSLHHFQMQQDDLRKRQQQMQARLSMGTVVQRSNSQAKFSVNYFNFLTFKSKKIILA